MKKISLNEFKEGLSDFAEEVAEGEIIEVTKYNRPYIRVVAATQEGLTIGRLYRKGELKPVLKRAVSLSKILKVLEEDRDGR